MDWQSVSAATTIAFAGFVAWWAGILYLDGALAMELPYHQYERAALLYPDVFYPGVPGLYLTQVLYAVGVSAVLGSLTFLVGLVGWMLALSAAIGVGATWYASRRARSPPAVAAVAVLALFVAITAVEAAVMLA